jgi:hypothetical protein
MRPQIAGSKVRSRDGARLGKVGACGATYFTIERRRFFGREYFVSYDDIEGIARGEVHLGLTKQQLRARETPPAHPSSTMLGGMEPTPLGNRPHVGMSSPDSDGDD